MPKTLGSYAGATCSSPGCILPAYGRFLCKRHYQTQYMREYREGRTPRAVNALKGSKQKYRKSQRGRQTEKAYYEKNKEKLSRRAWEGALRRSFGMSVSEYEERLSQQEGRCALCQRPESGRRRLAVDHDHVTGRVRALLCAACNLLIGHLEKRRQLIERGLEYLQKYQ